jgi:hypothetical protein
MTTLAEAFEGKASGRGHPFVAMLVDAISAAFRKSVTSLFASVGVMQPFER